MGTAEYTGLIRHLRRRGGQGARRHLWAYTGFVATSNGLNWDEYAYPLTPDPGLLDLEQKRATDIAAKLNVNVTVVNAGGMSQGTFAKNLKRYGVHAIVFGYGAFDPVVREVVNLPRLEGPSRPMC